MPKLSIKEYLALRREGYTSEEISAYKAEPEEETPAPAPGSAGAGDGAGHETHDPAPAPEVPDIAEQIKDAVAEALAELHLDNINSSGSSDDDPPGPEDPIALMAEHFSKG